MIKYCLAIAALCFFVYANSLNNAFVSDDIPAILDNPDIGNIFASGDLTGAGNSLIYRLTGAVPFGYHLANIILHALNSLLVFAFLLLFFKPVSSFWGALIFAAHPVHTEAVTWISGRPYELSAAFMLLSLLLYIRAAAQPKIKWLNFAGALVFYVFAISTCTFALAFAALPALYDFTFARWRRAWKLWPGFFALSALKLWLMAGAVKARIAQVGFDTGSTGTSNPFFNAAFSIFAYLGMLLWPRNLTLYHEPLFISPLALGAGVFLLALLFLSLPLIFRKNKLLFFSICLFIIFLSPTYSPRMISWLVAERYLYFPSLAFSIWLLLLLAKYSPGKKLSPVITAFLICLVCAYSLRTIIRNRDWASHTSIWRATVRVSPYSPKAHNNMGDVYCLEGDLEKAALEFQRAIELKPDYADAYHNLANTYLKMGRVNEAVFNYKKALEFNPNLQQSRRSLEAIYSQGD